MSALSALRAWAGIACLLVLAGCVASGGLVAPAGSALSGAPGPQGGEGEPWRRQAWLIPSPEPGILMRAFLYRPAGPGPFPVAVVNHGSAQDAIARARMPPPEFAAVTGWFVARGYAVLVPQRPGHGATGGRYIEDQGPCARADFVRSGRATADSIAAAIGFMTAEDFIRPAGAVVVGNSAGGWGALALASRNPPEIAAVVTFAAGRGGRNRGRPGENCAPERLVAAAAAFGRTARVPALLLYAENDTYFPPDLSRRLAEAYRAGGGSAEYHLLPAIAGDGHELIGTAGPAAPWAPPLAAFMDRIR